MVCTRLGPIDQTPFGQFRKSAADVLWNPPLAVNRSCAGKTGGEGAEPRGVSVEGAVLS
jgi:hypothetical protein